VVSVSASGLKCSISAYKVISYVSMSTVQTLEWKMVKGVHVDALCVCLVNLCICYAMYIWHIWHICLQCFDAVGWAA